MVLMALLQCCFWKQIVLSLSHTNNMTLLFWDNAFIYPILSHDNGWVISRSKECRLKKIKKEKVAIVSAFGFRTTGRHFKPRKKWVMLDLRNFWLEIKTLRRVQFTTWLRTYDSSNSFFLVIMTQPTCDKVAFVRRRFHGYRVPHTGKQVNVSCSLNDQWTPYS